MEPTIERITGAVGLILPEIVLVATACAAFLAGPAGKYGLIWRVSTLREPPVRIANDGRLHFTALAFHPSGRFLAATSNDATVKLYDTNIWALAKTYTWNIGRSNWNTEPMNTVTFCAT